jgi:hypothetical protein
MVFDYKHSGGSTLNKGKKIIIFVGGGICLWGLLLFWFIDYYCGRLMYGKFHPPVLNLMLDHKKVKGTGVYSITASFSPLDIFMIQRLCLRFSILNFYKFIDFTDNYRVL